MQLAMIDKQIIDKMESRAVMQLAMIDKNVMQAKKLIVTRYEKCQKNV